MNKGNLPESGSGIWSEDQKAVPQNSDGLLYRCVICGQFPKVGSEWTHCHGGKAVHCYDCGQIKCQCCENCQNYPCTCEHNEGEDGAKFRVTAPWVERGITIYYGNSKYTSWTEAWPLLVDPEHGHEATDVCQAAADFYLLDALKAGVLNRGGAEDQSGLAALAQLDNEVRFLKRYAGELHDELVGWLDPLFRQYVDMACGGELRHHSAVGQKAVSHERREAWANWRTVRDTLGAQALLDMADLFYDWGKTGNTGYGGPLWAKGAELLYDRETGKITAQMWCDRVFTLVHNGGPFLNKLNWAIRNPSGWSLDSLQRRVLPAHASDNFNLLLRVASREVCKLWDDYWKAMNKVRVRVGARPVANLRRTPKCRVICRHCYSNPKVGHSMGCYLYLNGYLSGQWNNKGKNIEPQNFITVPEEDWNDWGVSAWEYWSKKDQPVSPDGLHVQITPDTDLTIVFEVHHGFSMAQSVVTKQAKDVMKLVFTPADTMKECYAKWDNVTPKFYWVVQVWTANSGSKLGEFKSKSVEGYDKFASLVIDCGLVLPAAMTTMDWSPVVNQWKKEVISA